MESRIKFEGINIARKILVLFGILFLLGVGTAQAYTITMTGEDLDKRIEKFFPFILETPFYTLRLHTPRAVLKTGSERLGLKMMLTMEMPESKRAEGVGHLEGEISYDAKKGELHFRNPALVSFSVEGLPTDFEKIVRDSVNMIASQHLPIIVVYRLDEDEQKMGFGLMKLKSVQVKNGKLIVEIGL